jgi:hypothetical protein
MATRRRRDSNLREYRFKIDAYEPKTIPLIRLTAYLHELAVLFGNTDNVHLDRIEEGSTEPVLLIEREAEIKVRERLQIVRANDGPEDAMRAHKNINEMLRADDGKASVIDPIKRKILIFQGRDLNKLLEYGPFTQPGTLEGVPIKMGGEGDWVPVHLQDSLGEVHWCWAKRSLAREIARHIFGSVIRVDGTARWVRKRDGEWDMVSFRAKGFAVLDSDKTLRETIQHLRAVPAKWKELDDPLGELKKIRHGT